MILSLTRAVARDHLFPALLLLVGTGGGIFCFTFSYLFHSNVLIGLLLFPFSLFITGQRKNNLAYLALILMCGSFAFLYQVRISYFFTLAFFTLWLIEYFAGRVNTIVLFLLFFMSPFFFQVTTILGFPIRLYLSKVAGSLLAIGGFEVQVEGNVILLNGAGFSVDDACMGLSMLSMSMLMAVFLMTYQYRVTGKYVGLFGLTFFFLAVLWLNVIANLLRIIVLVILNIPPEHSLHELLGMFCFILYIIVPAWFISRWLVGKATIPDQKMELRVVKSFTGRILMLLLTVAVFFTGVKIGKKGETHFMTHAQVSSPDAKIENLVDGVTLITDAEMLAYVKPIPEFFTGEHTPLICWKGSGYAIKGVKEIVVEGRNIYTGRLIKNDDVLYTAWWYSNGTTQTISQPDWRWRMLKGEKNFCLINVTAANEEVLMRNIESVMTGRKLMISH